MKIRKFHVYLADLNPRFGTEPGKIRPVVVLQTDLLNNEHPSTVICPITTNVIKESSLLRIHRSDDSFITFVVIGQITVLGCSLLSKSVCRTTTGRILPGSVPNRGFKSARYT